MLKGPTSDLLLQMYNMGVIQNSGIKAGPRTWTNFLYLTCGMRNYVTNERERFIHERFLAIGCFSRVDEALERLSF